MKAVAEDIQAFLQDINQTDKKLQRETERDDRSKDIFGSEDGSQKENKSLNAMIEEIERKKQAENERLKGNECMKAKDY